MCKTAFSTHSRNHSLGIFLGQPWLGPHIRFQVFSSAWFVFFRWRNFAFVWWMWTVNATFVWNSRNLSSESFLDWEQCSDVLVSRAICPSQFLIFWNIQMPKSCRYYINISRSRESAFERLNEVKSKAKRFFLGQSEFHQTKWTGRSDIVLFAYFQPNVNLINYCVQVDHVTFGASDSISLSKSKLAIFTYIYM